MGRRSPSRAGALAALAALAVLAAAAGPASDASRAAPAPAFPASAFARLDGGGALELPGAPGALVVNVWATWCEPCRREMASLERLHRRLGPEGVRVVGISVDSDRHLAAEFVRGRGLTFDNAIDAEGRLVRGALAVRRFPTTFVVDRAGVVRWREEAARDWSDPASVERVRRALAAGR